MDEYQSFGEWVRRRRKALDLTQQHLSNQVGCSVMTIRKIENGSRRPSRQIAERLAEQLRIDGRDHALFLQLARVTLYDEAVPSAIDPLPDLPQHSVAKSSPPDVPLARPAPVQLHNLPSQLTPLIGRDNEVAELVALLAQPMARLVTLTGPGGIGKTRLSLQAAQAMLGQFPDGVWFVGFEAVHDPLLVLATIAQAIGIRETGSLLSVEALCAALHEQQMLLVLDNLEHLTAAAPEIAALLRGTSQLKILATSREILHLTGERVVSVAPLAIPERTGEFSNTQLGEYPAIQLFVERAQALNPDFVLTDANVLAVVEICARLDGLPLAIELAAPWIQLFDPVVLLQRLERRLSLSTRGLRSQPTRQQTLRDTLAWSYALLTPIEQQVFRHLGVFAAGCTIESAMAVAGTNANLDILLSLINKSMLQRVSGADAEPRLLMLETLREYALEQLEQHGEAEQAAAQHAAYMLNWTERTAPKIRGTKEHIWFQTIEAEHDNLRLALQHLALNGEWVSMARLGIALYWFWWMRGYCCEGLSWLEQIHAGLSGANPAPQLRAHVLIGLAWMWTNAGEFVTARSFAEEGLALAQSFGDRNGQARAWNVLGYIAFGLSDLKGMWKYMETAQEHYQAVNDIVGVAEMLTMRGVNSRIRGQFTEAQALLEQGLQIARQSGSASCEAQALQMLGTVLISQGAFAEAKTRIEQALGLQQLIGNRRRIATTFIDLGEVAYLQGDYPRAIDALQQALALRRTLGDRRGMIGGLNSLGRAARAMGQLLAALRWNGQALMLARELEYYQGYHWCLLLAGGIAAMGGDAARAAWLLGAAEQLAESKTLHIGPEVRSEYDQAVAVAQQQLTDVAFAEAWAAGRSADLAVALDVAMTPLSQELVAHYQEHRP